MVSDRNSREGKKGGLVKRSIDFGAGAPNRRRGEGKQPWDRSRWVAPDPSPGRTRDLGPRAGAGARAARTGRTGRTGRSGRSESIESIGNIASAGEGPTRPPAAGAGAGAGAGRGKGEVEIGPGRVRPRKRRGPGPYPRRASTHRPPRNNLPRSINNTNGAATIDHDRATPDGETHPGTEAAARTTADTIDGANPTAATPAGTVARRAAGTTTADRGHIIITISSHTAIAITTAKDPRGRPRGTADPRPGTADPRPGTAAGPAASSAGPRISRDGRSARA